MGLPLPDYADFYVWVGVNIEWIPTIRYFGGFKMVFPKVDKEMFYYGDLSKMYEKSGGECTNLTVYYCLPGQPLDSGIRKLEGDNDILDLIRAYKGENVVPIYIEESGGPLLIIGPDGNVIEPHDDMLALPPCDQTNQPIDLDEQYDADSENQFTENIDDENPDNENNVNEEIVCENIDIENPLTENSVLQNDVFGIPDTENSVFENLGAENQFTENIDIENPDNENNVENPLIENIEIENPLIENMDEDFFEQLYNDENLINEAVDLNNEFEDGAWASVSDEDGQNEEGVGESDSSSVSDCPSWMLEDLEGPDDDDIFQERPPDHAKKLFKALRSFLKDKKRQRVEAQLEEQEVQRRANEEGWYSDVEEENEDDLDALRGSDEEGERYVVWNDDMEKRGVDLFVGLQFATRKKYKEVLKDWVVRRGWDLKFLKSERDKVTTIYNPNEGLESLKNKIRRDVQVECSMHKVYRAKRYALELLRGDVKEQYNRLYDYCATVVKHNPNSSMVLKIDRSLTPPVLERMYCCLSGCKEGLLDGCRLIIGLDGCFLKGLYKGQLLTAVGRDGNDNLVPIAYAMVEVENDRQKGLVKAVAKVAPRAEHRFCVRHMYNNFKATFKGVELKQLFWKTASTYNLIGQARELPIIEMFEWIRKKCMTRIQIKRQGMEKYAGIYCSCGMFQLVGYPCCHAVASIASLRLDIENYVDDCFKKDTYLRVYSHMVNPVLGMHDFEDSVLGIVDPPHIRILLGRPRKMPPQAADEDAYMPHIDSEMPPQSATNHSTANPPPQSETGTSTELPSASQPRRQAASQPERSQTASQSMPFVASQPVRRPTTSQPVRRQSASQPLRRQTAPKTTNASTSAQLPTQPRRKSATQHPTTQTAPRFRSASQTSQGPTVGGQTSNDSTHRSSSHLPAFEVPTFGGQATTIFASEGPPIPTQSQSSQNPQQMPGQSHKSRKQGNPASLSSRKLQKMKQVLSPTPNPAFKKPSLPHQC
ncbi:hypothetical protein BUALT_Bualt15G0101000 [Buddleja alternifolia]|uniref:SWIM-type domain-containing protein n=1 Tax=Buddleja alternifolia TaxID=168488 RepID=A0AAV6WFX3_9LAMI|nr:hypothetical protein BUALT_Bualt15G0101000 [Buddleja alternifolia]